MNSDSINMTSFSMLYKVSMQTSTIDPPSYA